MSPPLLVVFATFDPRGIKIGGIETHIRHMMRHHPEGTEFLLVGLDESGDLTPGEVVDITFDGRPIRFLPLAHIRAEVSAVSARSLGGSTTLRFVLAGLRHIGALRRAVKGRRASADLPRLEFSILPILMGLPYVLTVHSEIAVPEKTDSLLRHYRQLRRLSEKFGLLRARHVFAVSHAIHGPLLEAYPTLKGRTDVLPVPVDTDMFTPSPFPGGDVFHLIYAGRFGAQKDPPLMFATIAALKRRLEGKLRFHVLSSENPESFAAFAQIRDVAVLHGPQTSPGVARILREVHCGMLTSQMEGLPCFLLETLASGRAFGSVMLPSLVPFVIEGESGLLVERGATQDETAEAIAEGLASVWDHIRAGRFDPAAIAARTEPFAVKKLLRTIFAVHERLLAGQG